MQAAERTDTSELDQAEGAIERLGTVLESGLVRLAGLDAGGAARARDEMRSGAWRRLLAAEGPDGPEARARGAALAAAAVALRGASSLSVEGTEPTPLPDGLDAAALQGAQREIIPGRRSVAGLHLRGLGLMEMAPIFGLAPAEMETRLALALQDLRTVLHRRAQRMNRADWSRGFEAQPLEATRGMLRERPTSGRSRLQCTAPEELAEAVNGTHFRGGREGALDHACACDPCAAELRVLLRLRAELHPSGVEGLDLAALRRSALRREELRAWVEEPTREARRRFPWWAWVVGLFLLAAAVAWLR